MRQVVELRAKGRSLRGIAGDLGVVPSTVLADLRAFDSGVTNRTPRVPKSTAGIEQHRSTEGSAVNSAPETPGRFEAEHCDACDNTGICDYGNGNEPCRSVMHHAARVAHEQPDEEGGDHSLGGAEEGHSQVGERDGTDEEPSVGSI
jgi:hypothetical protein